MNTFLPNSKIFTVIFFIANMFLANVAFGQATVLTDLLDYPPGSTAIITGSGFLAGETVTLLVEHVGDAPLGTDEQYHQPWTVIADADGNISTSWYVPTVEEGDAFGATFLLTADGAASLLHAEWTFTDGNCPTPSFTTQPLNSAVCESTGTSFTVVATATGTPVLAYQWQERQGTGNYSDLSNGGIYSGVLSSTLTLSSGVTAAMNGWTYKCIVLNSAAGCNAKDATSNSATLTVNPNVTPSVSIAASPSGAICAGTSVIFTATPTNGGSTPVYQWKKNGVNVGTNSTTYTDNGLVNGDKIICVMISNAQCASPISPSSNELTMIVNPLPTAFNVSYTGSLCGTALITLDGSQNGVNYELKRNTVTVETIAGIGSSFSFSGVTQTGTYTVVATNTSTTCSITMNGSVVLTGGSPPTVYNVTGGGTFCIGGIGFPVGVDNSQNNVNYQLYRDATPVGSPVAGSNGNAISFGNQTVAGTYTVIATNNSGCTSEMTGSAIITVTPNVAVTSVTGGTTPQCIGEATTFTANGVVLGGGSGAWSSSNESVATVDSLTGEVTAVSAGTVDITFTITGGCNGTPSASKSYTVTPNAAVTSVTGGTTPQCIGDTTTFTANGVVLGGGSGSWSSSNTSVATVNALTGEVTAVSAGTVDITFTITGGCNGTSSASKSYTVTPNAAVTSVTGSPNSICQGTTTTYIANGVVLGGGTGGWTSDNTAVATVHPTTGVVTGVSQGTANIKFTITGGCNGIPSAQKSITVKAPTVINDHLINNVTNTKIISIVYGCTTPELKVAATGHITILSPLTYKWFKNTTNSNVGGTQVSINPFSSSYTVPVTSGVGVYYYYAEVTGGCGTVKSDVFEVTIIPQPADADLDAVSYYTGPNVAWTPTTTSNTATVTLSAFLKNSTAEGAECGDISTARVTFLQNGVPIPSATNLPVNFVDPNNPAKGGTAAAIVQLSISSNASSEIFDIKVVISGNYTANEAEGQVDQILVGKLIPGGAIGGGAKLLNLNSTGFVKGAILRRTTATFGVEYSMKGKNVSNPKGRVTIMIPSYNDKYGNPTSDLHWYFVKSNAIAGMTITSPTATFTSKANISEYNQETDVYTAIEGNCTMVIDMGDYSSNSPNVLDKVGVTVYRNSGGVWYSNNWVNTKTVMTNIFGGDVSVTGNISSLSKIAQTETAKTAIELPVESTSFNAIVYPNPSVDQFTVAVEGSSTENVKVAVFDVLGRLLKTIEKKDGETIQFGEDFPTGTYIAKISQGAESKTVQLIKK